MRKTMRTAFVSAAVVGLGLAGAATAQADGSGGYVDQETSSNAAQHQGFNVNSESGVSGVNDAAASNATDSEAGQFAAEDPDDDFNLFGGGDD